MPEENVVSFQQLSTDCRGVGFLISLFGNLLLNPAFDTQFHVGHPMRALRIENLVVRGDLLLQKSVLFSDLVLRVKF